MIRTGELHDVSGIVDLAESMHGESIYRSLPFSRERFTDCVVDYIGNHFVVVADIDGEIVGAIVGGVSEHCFSDCVFGYELGVFVRQENRGGTIAYKMLRELIEWCVANGAAHIDLGITTGIHTEKTGRMYEKMGFELCGSVYRLGG